MNVLPIFKCLDCGSGMNRSDGDIVCPKCGRRYNRESEVILAKPVKLSKLSEAEEHYHDEFDENAVSVHQLGSWRNLKYHDYIWRQLKCLPEQSSILEVGAGSGFDARQIAGNYNLVLGDISADTLNRTVKTGSWPQTIFVALDGLHLPFADDSFDAVYIVATFHHFEHPQMMAAEMGRVLKPGGLAIVGIEPNNFYFNLIKKFRKLLCSLAHQKVGAGSQADAEMAGFKESDLRSLFGEPGWKLDVIKPVWLFAGWLHYGSEFLYRMLRLKKRFQVNQTFEKAVVGLDELLFKIPLVHKLCWHWIVVAKKN